MKYSFRSEIHVLIYLFASLEKNAMIDYKEKKKFCLLQAVLSLIYKYFLSIYSISCLSVPDPDQLLDLEHCLCRGYIKHMFMFL